jgi:hypothetical protein
MLREVFARFGIEVDDAKLQAADKAVSDFSSGLQKLGGLLAGGAIGAAFWGFARATADIGDAIQDNATRLGISTQAYQELGYAASLSASNAEQLTSALLMLQDRAVDAAQGGEGSAKSFRRLGVAVKNAHGDIKPSDELLLDVADKIAAMEDPAKQTAAAVDAFGRGGRALLPFLKQGRKGISALTEEARELGGGFDEAAVAASAEFNDAIDRSHFVVNTLRGRIATALLPALRWLVDGFTKAGAWIARMTRGSEFFTAALGILASAFTVLGIRALAAMWPIILPLLKATAAFVLLALIVDDVITLFKGGKSVIGEAIDTLMGAGTAAKAVEWLKMAWAEVVDNVKISVEWVKAFVKSIDDAANKLAALIGMQSAATAKGSSEDQRNILRRQAAAAGQVVRFPGETPEQAQAQMAFARQQIGQKQVASPMAGGTSSSSNNNVNVVVNAGNADAAQTAALVDQKVNETLERRTREAVNALTRESR